MSILFEASTPSSAEFEKITLGTDWSSGDNVAVYTANPEGSRANIKHGTSASPTTETKPTFKVSRTSGVTGGVTGDGATEVAAIYGSAFGKSSSKIQEVGVIGTAKNEGTAGEPDACGVYGVGRILSTGKGRAFGGFFAGRRDAEGLEQRATGAEIYLENLGGTDTYDITTGAETSKGLWIHSGTAKVAVGAQFGTISEATPGFDVGIGFNKFSIGFAAIADYAKGEYSYYVKEAHSKAAFASAEGAGPTLINVLEKNFAGEQLLEVYYGEGALDPGVVFGTGKAKACSMMPIRNSSGNLKIFAANAANNFMTNTAQGDTGLAYTPGKAFHIGAQTKTSMLRMEETKVGLFGVAPVARAAAITEPAETLASLKEKVNSIRTVLKNIGITE